MMVMHVQKWGNSLGIRLPSMLVRHLKIQAGTPLEIKEQEGSLIITPIKPRYDLKTMLAAINEHNLHPLALEDDRPRGEESW